MCLLVTFTGVGAALSREWGWREYASDELYLVYRRIAPEPPYTFFLISTDDRFARWRLEPASSPLLYLECSPDGRTLAFITRALRLYVVDSSGLKYARAVEPSRRGMSVDNAGNVVYADQRILDANIRLPIVVPEPYRANSVVSAASGIALWSLTDERGIRLSLPDGGTGALLPEAFLPRWLASEGIFSFSRRQGADSPRRYLADTAMQNVVPLPDRTFFSVFSPDGLNRAVARVDPNTGYSHVFLADAFSDAPLRQISTFDELIIEPVCFLTFKPDILISASP